MLALFFNRVWGESSFGFGGTEKANVLEHRVVFISYAYLIVFA
jgi:hypothetical protein